MDYLKKEWEEYKALKEKRPSLFFELFAPIKAHMYVSLDCQLQENIRPFSKILEVGFGSGFLLAIQAMHGHPVSGVDKEPFTHEYARELFKEKKVTGNLISADAFALPFKDDSFDLVTSNGMVEHYTPDEQVKLTKEMARVSRRHVLISVPNDSPYSGYEGFKQTLEYCPEEENILDLPDLMKESGMRSIREGGMGCLDDKLYKTFAEELGRKPSFIELIELELAASDKHRRLLGFLKYSLAEVKK